MQKSTKATHGAKSNGTHSKESATKAKQSTSSGEKKDGNKSKLEEFFIDELKDIYWAEKHLIKALP